jgi:hypothetical protein
MFIETNLKDNPGTEQFWNSIGWTVATDIKYLYKVI